MIVIICAKYRKNPFRTVNATDRTRFSKSRPNDLDDIGQGQGSSHATHPLMLLIICTKDWKNPSWTVDATGRTRKVNGQTDRQTDRQTDKVNPIYPLPNFVVGGYENVQKLCQLSIFCVQVNIHWTTIDIHDKQIHSIMHKANRRTLHPR